MSAANDVQLRDVTADDLPVFFEHQREPEANQMAAFPAREREAFMAHVAKHNLGSRRVLEKCGFTVLGEDRFSYGTPEEEFEEFTLILNGQSDDKA